MNKPYLAILIVGLLVSTSLLGFLVGQASVDTTDYYLDTPLPLASYYVGVYSNGSYFAVNGSNWDNFLVSTNASLVLNTVTDALDGTGGKIVLGSGTFDLSSSYWSIAFSTGTQLIIEGSVETTLQGTGTYILFSERHAWQQSNAPRLELKYLTFSHNCPSGGATLFLAYINANLDSLYLDNSAASKTGSFGIKGADVYANESTGNPSMFSWDNIAVVDYGTNFYFGSFDHLTANNLVSSMAYDYHYFFQEGMHNVFNNFHIYTSASDNVNCYNYYFNACTSQNVVINPKYENHSISTRAMLHYANFDELVYVQNPDARGGGVTLANDKSYFVIESETGVYKSRVYSSRTVANNEWCPHYVWTTPNYVTLTLRTITYDDVPVVLGLDSSTMNATKFQIKVYWANGTAVTADAISIYYYADAS